MNFLLRLIWFLIAGWWLGLLWFSMSLALMMTIIFFPVGAWAATKTWKVMTLSGSDSASEAVTDVTVNVNNKMKQEISDGEKQEDEQEENWKEDLEASKDLYCPNCGEEVEEDESFCSSCGEEL